MLYAINGCKIRLIVNTVPPSSPRLSLVRVLAALFLVSSTWSCQQAGESPVDNRGAALHLLGQALQAARTIKDEPEPHKGFVVSQIAEAQARAGDFTQAIGTSLQAGGDWGDSALWQVVMAQAKSGDLDGARSFVQRNFLKGRREHALIQIARVQASKGDANGALLAARQLGPDAVDEVLGVIGTSKAKAGDISAARKTLLSIRSVASKEDVLSEIALAQARAGDPDAALKTIKDIDDPVMKYDLPIKIARARIEAGDTDWASREAARLDAFGQTILLTDIAETCAKLGRRDEAAKTFKKAVRVALQNNHGAQLGEIAGAQYRTGIGTDAQIAIDGLPDGKTKRQAYDYLGAAYAHMGRYKDAIACLRRSAQGVYSYKIAEVLVQSGQIDGAIEMARLLPNPSDTSSTLAELAKEAARRGDYKGALKLASQVVIRNLYFEHNYRAYALREVARAGVKSGAVQEVLAWAGHEEWPFSKACAYLGAAEGLLDVPSAGKGTQQGSAEFRPPETLRL